MLEIDIKKTLGDFELDVEFSSNAKIIGLLGASGSGKSSVLRIIAGLIKPDSGIIRLDNELLFDSMSGTNIRVQDRRIGYLFQDYALFPNMSCVDNICCGIRQGSKKEKLDKALAMMSDLKIKHLAKLMPNTISGGEKQRVALGRLLVNQPRLILMDEPFSALDEHLRWQVETEVRGILDKFQIPAILVSHSRAEVYRLCDEACILNNGSSEKIRNTKELFEKPETLQAAILSGCKNYSRIKRISDNEISAVDWNMRLRISESPEERDMIGIRANHIEITDRPTENSIELNIITVIEELFSMIIIAASHNESCHFRIELSKKQYSEMLNYSQKYVSLDRSRLMLLNSKI